MSKPIYRLLRWRSSEVAFPSDAVARDARGSRPFFHTQVYAYYAAVILMLAYALNYLDRSVLVILAEPVKHDLGLADWQIGVMTGPAFALFYATMGLPIAKLADRLNRVKILSLALVTWSAMTILCGRATSFFHLAMARVGVGIGEAGGSPPSASIISDYFPVDRRATALAIYAMGAPLGVLVGLAAGGWVAHHFGWRTAFYLAGAPGLLLAILISVTLREPERQPSSVPASRSLIVTLRSLRANRLFWGAMIAKMVSGPAINVMSVWVPLNLIRSHHLDVQTVGLAMGIISGATGIVGAALGGMLTDRLFRKDSRWLFWLAAIAYGLYFPIVLLSVAAPTLWLSLPLLALASLLLSGTDPALWSLTQATVQPHERATALAVNLFAYSVVGGGLVPVLAGALSDVLEPSFGDDRLRIVIPLFASTAVLAAWLFWRTARLVSTAPPLE